MRQAKLLLFLLPAVAIPMTVDAATISIYSPVNTYLSAGHHERTLDLRGWLASPDFSAPYDFTSAQVTFFFSDNLDALNYNYGATSPYSPGCGWGGCAWYRSEIHYMSDPYEYAHVSDGLGVSTGSATPYRKVQYYLGGRREWDGGYTDIWREVSGYWGDIALSAALSSGSLSSLADDGVWNYSIDVSGDLRLNGVSLQATVEPNPVTTQVPEPGTVLFIALGSALVLGCARLKTRLG